MFGVYDLWSSAWICGSIFSLECAVHAEGMATRATLERGFSQVTRELQEGFSRLDHRLQEGFTQLDHRLQEGFTQLEHALQSGFNRTMEELAGLRMASEQLVAIARTPAHTASLEHYRAACDSFRRGLLPEALEDLERAISGVMGVSAGYKTDWRFHALRGLIYLGVGTYRDERLVNPIRAFQSFELTLRYLDPSDATQRSAFLTCGGRAKVLLDTEGADEEALRWFDEAIRVDRRNVLARMDLGRVAARRGRVDQGLPAVKEACGLDLRMFEVVEQDRALAIYRPEIAAQKAAEIAKLEHALPGLYAAVVAAIDDAERLLGRAWQASQKRPQDDPAFRRTLQAQYRQLMGGFLLIVLSLVSCGVLPKLDDHVSIGARGAVIMVLGLLAMLVMGVVLIVGSQSKQQGAWLARVLQGARVRLQQDTAAAHVEARARIDEARDAANAWLECLVKLGILRVAPPAAALQLGNAACVRLDRLIASSAGA